MKKRWFRIVSFLLIPLLVGSAFVPATAAFAQAALMPNPAVAHVKLAHFAPFADTVDGTSVDVTLDTVIPVGTFKFGDVSPVYVDIPAGTHHVQAAKTVGSEVILSADVDLVADTYYTISMIGNITPQPIELLQQIDDTVTPLVGAKVRFTHVAPVAADINATKIDVCTSANVVVPGLAGIAYKSFNDPYITLPPGDYQLKIATPGTSCAGVLLNLPSIRLSTGQILDAYFIGDGIHLPLALASTTAITFTPFAHVKFNHFASFDMVAKTLVTVKVDGIPILTDFKFGDMTPGYLDISAGVDHQVDIVPSAGGAALITKIINLDENTYYTLSAIGDNSNQPLELFQLVDDNTRPPSGARIRFALFAPIANLPAINICTENGELLVENFVYKDFTNPYISRPAGIYHLKITAYTIIPGAACSLTLITIPTVVLIDRTVVSVFAIGDNVNVTPTVALRWDQAPFTFIPIIKK